MLRSWTASNRVEALLQEFSFIELLLYCFLPLVANMKRNQNHEYCERCGNRFDTYGSHVELEQTNQSAHHPPNGTIFSYYLCFTCAEDYEQWLEQGRSV